MFIWCILSFSTTCGYKLHPQWFSHADAAHSGVCWFSCIFHLQVQKVWSLEYESTFSWFNLQIRNCKYLSLVKTFHSCSSIFLSSGKSLGSMSRLRTVMRRNRKWSVQSARMTTYLKSSSVSFPLRKNSWKRSWRPGAEVYQKHIYYFTIIYYVYSMCYTVNTQYFKWMYFQDFEKNCMTAVMQIFMPKLN